MAPRAEGVRNLVVEGARALASAGVPSPEREARALWVLAGGTPWETEGSWLVSRRYTALLSARARGVPRALLEGETGFLDFDVRVRPGVFIPRPETEELAERAVALFHFLPPRALDLGTGTGVLALALARARPEATVLAVDRSPRALACARANVRRLGLEGGVQVRYSDWFSAVDGRFGLIVSNPPYVARRELASLPPEVRRYEPRWALDGGEDGLDAIRLILDRAPAHLLPGGWLLLEIGDGQGEAVLRWAERGTWAEVRVERDLAGRERFFLARCG